MTTGPLDLRDVLEAADRGEVAEHELLERGRVDPRASFVHFVFPFVFDAGSFADRVAAVEAAQVGGRSGPQAVWEKQPYAESYLLPHVARYLNPPDDQIAPTARVWKLSGAIRDVYGTAGRADWRLRIRSEKAAVRELPFRIGEDGRREFAVQLALFRVGTGLLTLRVRLDSDRIGDWLDLLHFFRYVRGQQGVDVSARRRVGIDPATRERRYEPFFPQPAGGPPDDPAEKRYFGTVLDALLESGASASDGERWWREIYVPGRLIPFAALYVDDLAEAAIPPLLHRVRKFFTSRLVTRPSAADLELDGSPTMLPYAHHQWYLFSLGGGSFVACDAPDTDFYRFKHPEHLREHYFLVFLLALHQRFTLMHLSDQVSAAWPEPDEAVRTREFRRIRDALHDFTARGYFTQVMQLDHHHACYVKWQQTFQIEQLYQEVVNEVRDMHQYLIERAATEEGRAVQSLGILVSALGAVFGIPALVFSYLSINLLGITSRGEGLDWWVVLVAGLVALLVGMSVAVFINLHFLRRWRRQDAARLGAHAGGRGPSKRPR